MVRHEAVATFGAEVSGIFSGRQYLVDFCSGGLTYIQALTLTLS